MQRKHHLNSFLLNTAPIKFGFLSQSIIICAVSTHLRSHLNYFKYTFQINWNWLKPIIIFQWWLCGWIDYMHVNNYMCEYVFETGSLFEIPKCFGVFIKSFGNCLRHIPETKCWIVRTLVRITELLGNGASHIDTVCWQDIVSVIHKYSMLIFTNIGPEKIVSIKERVIVREIVLLDGLI